jgi:hypothetical protein
MKKEGDGGGVIFKIKSQNYNSKIKSGEGEK